MLRPIPLLVAWIGAVLAAPIQAAERVEADFVMTTSSGLVLVRTGKGAEVVALERGATLAGISSPQELRSGDRVRFSPVREARGVRFATSLELLPSVATAPELSVTPGEILALLAPRQDAAGRATLVDLRSAAAFERGHLPGAVSAPDWKTRLASTLPADREAPLVLYGVSRQDAASVEALRAALRLGYRNARLYVGGYREWAEENRATFVRARDLARRLGSEPLVVVDARPADEAGRGSLPRSVSVAPAALHPAGWNTRPPMPPLVLVGRDGADPAPVELAEKLRLWQPSSESLPAGTIQILEGGFAAWVEAGGAVETPHGSLDEVPCIPLEGEICAGDFMRLWREGGSPGAPLLLDVRPAAGAFRPTWARHIPIAELPERVGELPREREIVVFCARGITSRVAQALLARAGLHARFVRLPAPQQP